MAVWGQHEGEVFGEICCQCSECGWEDWQTPYWWSNYANFCPQCGTKMGFIEQKEDEGYDVILHEEDIPPDLRGPENRKRNGGR